MTKAILQENENTTVVSLPVLMSLSRASFCPLLWAVLSLATPLVEDANIPLQLYLLLKYFVFLKRGQKAEHDLQGILSPASTEAQSFLFAGGCFDV